MDSNTTLSTNKQKNAKVFVIGKYTIQEELGRGGMGIVYKAIDSKYNRVVALKVLLKDSTQNLQRFIRESKVMAQLDHNNIAKLYEFATEPQPFFAMEYIDGITLADLIRDRNIKPLQLVNIMIKVCDALKHAHKHKILHRDIKPANIIIDQNNQPKVMDFGLAKIQQGVSTEISKTGDVVGTAKYIAPEQIKGNPSPQSDIYSLGATMYEALTYQNIFEGDSYHNILFQVLRQDPTSPRKINPEISKSLETICLKCIAKNENERYQDIRELSRDLKNYTKRKSTVANSDFMLKIIGVLSIFVIVLTYVVFQYQAKDTKHSFLNSDSELQSYKDYVRRGETYQHQQQYQKALHDFTKALELKPQFYKSYYNRGVIYRLLGSNYKALRDFSNAIQINPNYAKAYNQRAFLYIKFKKHNRALVDFNKLIELDVSNYTAYHNRGAIHQYLKNYIKALSDYNKSLEINPSYEKSYRGRGGIYVKLEKYNRALSDFNKAIQLNPNVPKDYSNRAIIHQYLKNYGNAIDDYSRSLDLKPDFATYAKRATVYIELKKHKLALDDVKKAEEISPESKESYKLMYELYMALKDHAKAKYYLQKLRKS